MMGFLKIFSTITSRKAILIIGLCVLLVYGASLTFSFVGDDIIVIEKNDFVKSWKNFPKIFTEEYLTSPSEAYSYPMSGAGETSYRPVVTATYFVDYALWGLKPLGYHLTNILLHFINAILVMAFVRLFVRERKWALLGAVVFALHPVHTEVVNNISFREDLLAFLFYVSTLLLYIKSRAKNRYSLRMCSYITFLLAVFSKEMAITLPAVIMLYDHFFPEEHGKNVCGVCIFKQYGDFIILAILYLVIWKNVFPSQGEILIYSGQNAYMNFLTMSKVFAIYIGWLLVPVGIHPTFPDAGLVETSFFSLKVILACVLLLCVLGHAFFMRRRNKVITFAIAYFFIALLPVANIIPIQHIMAPRYLYFPMLGYALWLVVVLKEITARRFSPIREEFLPKIIFLGIAGLLIVYCVSTVTLSRTWKNGHSFFLELKHYYPNTSWVHKGLAKEYEASRLFNLAMPAYQEAKRLAPDDLENYEGLGRVYLAKAMYAQAFAEFEYVIRKDATRQSTYLPICHILKQDGHEELSAVCFEKLNPVDGGE